MTDWRALCAELAHEVEQYAEDRGDLMPECAERARAALAAEPVAEWPTDQQIADAFAEGCRDGSKAGEPPFLGGARAVLARYGHQPAPPAEGEVEELVRWLRQQGVTEATRLLYTRAAYLLEQRHPTPVPVSERLPGPEDCDAEGRCWLFSKIEKEWRLIDAGSPGVPRLKYCFSHWLPATALPLPSGEVEK